MASNKKLPAQIHAINAHEPIDGMNNKQLAALLVDMRATADTVTNTEAEAAEAVEVTTGPTVAAGKSITTKRGILVAGDAIAASDLAGGEAAFAQLVAKKYVEA